MEEVTMKQLAFSQDSLLCWQAVEVSVANT